MFNSVRLQASEPRVLKAHPQDGSCEGHVRCLEFKNYYRGSRALVVQHYNKQLSTLKNHKICNKVVNCTILRNSSFACRIVGERVYACTIGKDNAKLFIQ